MSETYCKVAESRIENFLPLEKFLQETSYLVDINLAF